MPKLPQVSGNKLIKFLKSIEYIVIRQKGSHVTLRKFTNIGNHNITIPKHNKIAKGTLNDIIVKISLWNNISREEIINRLK